MLHDPTVLALIITEQRCFAGNKRKRSVSNGFEGDHAGSRSGEAHDDTMAEVKKSVVSGIVTRIDLLEFVSRGD